MKKFQLKNDEGSFVGTCYGGNFISFGLFSKDYNVAYQPSGCKAYVHDQLNLRISNSSYCQNSKIDLEKTRLLMVCDRSTFEKLENLLDFLNQIEKKMGFELTEFIEFENNNAVGYVFGTVADPRWMISAPMISLYMLLIRSCVNHSKGDSWEKTLNLIIEGKKEVAYLGDKTYLTYSLEIINTIVEKGYEVFWDKTDRAKNWLKYTGHGDGIYAFFLRDKNAKERKELTEVENGYIVNLNLRTI